MVPAVMLLLGRANWYLPRWLDRVLPHLSLEGPAAQEVPQARAAARDDVATPV